MLWHIVPAEICFFFAEKASVSNLVKTRQNWLSGILSNLGQQTFCIISLLRDVYKLFSS